MPCKLCQHACHYVYMFTCQILQTFKSNCLVEKHSLRQHDLHVYLAVLKGTEAPEAQDVCGQKIDLSTLVYTSRSLFLNPLVQITRRNAMERAVIILK